VRADISRTRELTAEPFGVNLFFLTESRIDSSMVSAYARRLEPDARRYGIELGEPRFEDDAFEAKLELVLGERVPIVSFAFGCPPPEVVERLHERAIAVWVTVTEVEEALIAAGAGADGLIVQGVEAGGHRGSFEDREGLGELALLPLLRLVARAADLPLVASGGIADGAGVAAALAAGARAAQIGTGFLRCPEAATSPAHRDALASPGRTSLTRAFTGHRARGIVNRWLRDHDAHAPAPYPHVHHLTSPLRAAAREAGDAEAINLCRADLFARGGAAGRRARPPLERRGRGRPRRGSAQTPPA
jgi:nitronate monooxygenase